MSRSKKWRLEWAFFLGENGRRQYNHICKKCVHGCKQSFRACLVACPHYNRFESTSTFRRWKDRVDIPLIKIEDEDIAKLLSSVIDAVTIISNLYLKEYYQRRNRVIANYYFNKENAYDFFADTE